MNQEIFQKIRAAIVKIKEKNPYYLVAGIIVFAVLLDFFCVMQFQIRTLAKVNKKSQAFSKKIDKLNESIVNFEVLENTVINLDKQLERLSRKVHRQQDIPEVLEMISRIANTNKVIIEEMVPDTRFGKPVLQDTKRKYYRLPLSLNLKCSYHAFGKFLNELESEGIVADVVELQIAGDKKDTQRHGVRLVFNIIVFEEAG